MVLLAELEFEAEAVRLADQEAKIDLLKACFAVVSSNYWIFCSPDWNRGQDSYTLNAAAVTIANAAPRLSTSSGPAELIVDDGLLDVAGFAPRLIIGAIAAAYELCNLLTVEETSAQARGFAS